MLTIIINLHVIGNKISITIISSNKSKLLDVIYHLTKLGVKLPLNALVLVQNVCAYTSGRSKGFCTPQIINAVTKFASTFYHVHVGQ